MTYCVKLFSLSPSYLLCSLSLFLSFSLSRSLNTYNLSFFITPVTRMIPDQINSCNFDLLDFLSYRFLAIFISKSCFLTFTLSTVTRCDSPNLCSTGLSCYLTGCSSSTRRVAAPRPTFRSCAALVPQTTPTRSSPVPSWAKSAFVAATIMPLGSPCPGLQPIPDPNHIIYPRRQKSPHPTIHQSSRGGAEPTVSLLSW